MVVFGERRAEIRVVLDVFCVCVDVGEGGGVLCCGVDCVGCLGVGEVVDVSQDTAWGVWSSSHRQTHLLGCACYCVG